MRETNKARQAFEDYFNLGPGRSLRNLVHTYNKPATKKPPTKHLRTLATWSKKHNWQERVAQREQEIAAVALAEIKEKAALSGYAVFQMRIHGLNLLAELLWEEINTEDKRWVPDVKQIGSGQDAERIDLVRFNFQLIGQYRGALDDLAAEMGERAKKYEVTGPEGGPIEFDLDEWKQKREERVKAVADDT